MFRRLYAWLDDQTAFSRGGKKILDYVFPDHWSFMLGEVALYSFAVLVLTGVFLALYFVPSNTQIVYDGLYLPLHGSKMPESYASAINISFEVRAGLLMRQTHHWAADVFIGAIAVHMARIFFTGAYRRPCQLNWLIGVTLLALAVINGYLGYSLPDDLMSGQGVRIGFSIVESIPVVGQYLAIWLFGGNFPGPSLEQRFFIFHVLVVPLLLIGLITVHLALIVRPHHTQFAEKHRKETNVVGTTMWPGYAAKSTGFFFITSAILFLLGAFVEIDPFWSYGPYQPYRASDASQPDWYLGWLEGALRIAPAWEVHLPGHMIPEQFWPAIFLPLLTWGLFYSWPFLEARLTGDRAEHHLLDHPRDRPVRTGFGCAVFSFYAVLLLAGSDDVVADWLHLDLNDVVVWYRYLAVLLPVAVFGVAYKLCKELQRSAAAPTAVTRTVVVARHDDGSFGVAAVVPLQDAAAAAKKDEPEPMEVS